MDAEDLGGFALVALSLAKNGLDEALLKRADGLVEADPFADHFVYQRVQLFFQRAAFRS